MFRSLWTLLNQPGIFVLLCKWYILVILFAFGCNSYGAIRYKRLRFLRISEMVLRPIGLQVLNFRLKYAAMSFCVYFCLVVSTNSQISRFWVSSKSMRFRLIEGAYITVSDWWTHFYLFTSLFCVSLWIHLTEKSRAELCNCSYIVESSIWCGLLWMKWDQRKKGK